MRTVHKFPIVYGHPCRIDNLRRLCHAGLDPSGAPCLWADVWFEEGDKGVTREFEVFGTGHPVPPDRVFEASFVDGPFVWHVFSGSTGTPLALETTA